MIKTYKFDDKEMRGLTGSGFDENLWRLMVEKVTVSADGKLAFTLRNGMEK